MRLLTRYILKETTSHAILGVAMFTFVLFTKDVGNLLDLLVRATATPGMIAWLFLLLLPSSFTVTVPMGVLVGTLIGLSRMGSDSEVTAARASGMNIGVFVRPVAILATIGCLLGLTCSTWLGPRSIRKAVSIENTLSAKQVSAEVQPRVFEERFPNMVLYVNDAPSATADEWRGVFIADLTPPAAGSATPGQANSTNPKVTVAEGAITLPDPAHNQFQLHLMAGSTHQLQPQSGQSPGAAPAAGPAKNTSEYVISGFKESDITVSLPAPAVSKARPNTELFMSELLRVPMIGEDGQLARIEFHKRLAIPVASFMFALVALALGVSSRKGGKSMGVVLTLLLVVAYYLLLVFGLSFARQGRWPVGLGVWMPNIVFFVVGFFFVLRADSIRSGTNFATTFAAWMKAIEHHFVKIGQKSGAGRFGRLGAGFPQILDGYVLRGFIFYFTVFLAAFLVMVEIITFFDLLRDIVGNHVPWSMVGKYFFFLAPQLIYTTTPLAVLVAALVSFALLTKDSEIIAMKACGVSLYRVSLPVFLAAIVVSCGLFAFDHFYLAQANRIQDALRNQIKNRAPQTYSNPGRQWVLDQQHSRLFYYNYFDSANNDMAGLTIFDLDPRTFQIRRRVAADRAHWEDRLNAWVLESGWVREFQGTELKSYEQFVVKDFPDLGVRPAYFTKVVQTSQQMNYPELQAYIADLQQKGLDVVPLLVQLHKKFAFPLYVPIMALIAVPFAFSVGKRGALAGIAASMGIAMIYWTVTVLFEKMGGINALPPPLAAWIPAAMFGMSGLYLLLKVRT